MIAATPNSNLVVAVPTSNLMRSIRYGGNQVNNVFVLGTTSDFIITSTIDCTAGRFFNELESRGGANVVVIGYDVADALFPPENPTDKSVLINGQLFKVIADGLGQNARRRSLIRLSVRGWGTADPLALAPRLDSASCPRVIFRPRPPLPGVFPRWSGRALSPASLQRGIGNGQGH